MTFDAEGCPPQFAACITPAAGVALAHNVDALRRYSAEAWTRCGRRTPAPLPRKNP